MHVRDTARVDEPILPSTPNSWFSVRCVLRFPGDPCSAFEERVTLWCAPSMTDAVVLAEMEAGDYAATVGGDYTGLAQAYALVD